MTGVKWISLPPFWKYSVTDAMLGHMLFLITIRICFSYIYNLFKVEWLLYRQWILEETTAITIHLSSSLICIMVFPWNIEAITLTLMPYLIEANFRDLKNEIINIFRFLSLWKVDKLLLFLVLTFFIAKIQNNIHYLSSI